MSDGADPSVGDRVDSGVENLRTEVNSRIDSLQAKVDELSAKIDGLQGQSQGQVPNPPEAQTTPPPS